MGFNVGLALEGQGFTHKLRNSLQGKNQALADSGAIVPDSFEGFEGAIAKTFKGLVDAGKLTPQPNVLPPTIPQDLEAAKKAGKVSRIVIQTMLLTAFDMPLLYQCSFSHSH